MRRSLLLSAKSTWNGSTSSTHGSWAHAGSTQGMAPLAAVAASAGLASPSHLAASRPQPRPWAAISASPSPAAAFAAAPLQRSAPAPRAATCAASSSPDASTSSSSGSSRQPAAADRAGSSSSSAGGGSSGAPASDLRILKGVGPANELLLRQREIYRLGDLQDVYKQKCGGDVEELAKFLLSEVGIRRQHNVIAAAMQQWAAEQQAALEGGDAAHAMVTLAVEGNISAGKSTFLDVLSHEQTALNDMLAVVQEPVKQWQAVECRDYTGAVRTQNVLEKFYQDPRRYAYSFQHYVLISRMNEDIKSRQVNKALRVLERSIFSDRQVFVRAMHRSGQMEDFEVSVYNQIFDEHVTRDCLLVPDGFVYLRASPDTCMSRLRKRSRQEEVGIGRDYLEMLHANHEDWLRHGKTLAELAQAEPAMSLLTPASRPDAAREFEGMPGVRPTGWQYELIKNVPDDLKGQVLLLQGEDDLPQLRNRLALVMDHDTDVDIHNDLDARQEYAAKIKSFYKFVQDWKLREAAEQAAPPDPVLEALASTVASTVANKVKMELLQGVTREGLLKMAAGGSTLAR